MSFVRNFFDEIKTRKIIKEMGLYVASQEQVDGLNAPLLGSARARTAAGDIDWFAPTFEEAWQSKVMTEHGARLYEQLLSCLDRQPGADPVAHLKTFETYYQKYPCAATAGMYASQLSNRAYELRGTGWAKDVTSEQHDAMFAHFEQALEVLSEHADEGAGNFVWELGRYEATLNQHSDTESYVASHERLWELDRVNPFMLRTAGVFLLPRWYGSHEVLDSFARHAITQTHETLGLGAYALAYCNHGNVSENDVSESDVDLDLLKRSIYDLIERFPGTGMLNRAVQTASWADLHEVVLDIFARPLQEIHPPYWGLEMHDTEDAIEAAFLASNYARLHG